MDTATYQTRDDKRTARQIGAEKRAFRRDLYDMRSNDLLNLLIEQELAAILTPDDAMIAYKRLTCFEIAEFRLRETDHREENVSVRVSNLRTRLKAKVKQSVIPKSTTKQALQTARAAVTRMQSTLIHERGRSYDHGFEEGVKSVTTEKNK